MREVADALHQIDLRVQKLETEKLERWAAFESAIDKLIAMEKRRRKRSRDAEKDEDTPLNPRTGTPLDPISAEIYRRRGVNGPVRDQD